VRAGSLFGFVFGGQTHRGTETQQSTSNFDANGNLLVLDNIANLDWHYNNTLNQLTKVDKPNGLPQVTVKLYG
jgi:hypothetical protein